MIGTEHLIPDLVVADLVHDPLRGHEVVEPPAGVLRPRVHHVSPEGVLALGVGIEMAVGVHKTLLEQFIKAFQIKII